MEIHGEKTWNIPLIINLEQSYQQPNNVDHEK
jgi:hypothetical protein